MKRGHWIGVGIAVVVAVVGGPVLDVAAVVGASVAAYVGAKSGRDE